MAKEIIWIEEKDAAAMLHMKPISFRKGVKNGVIPVNFSRPHRLCHLYNKADIDAYILSCSTLTRSETRYPTAKTPTT